MDLEGRVAVVTGGAAGAGQVIVSALAARNARVVVADTDAPGGRQVVEQVRSGGGEAIFLPVDVCDDSDVEAMVRQASRWAGGPHVLVNNAGGWGRSDRQFPRAQPAEWGAVLALNLRAPMLATQLCMAAMSQAGGGAVVNISSIAGLGSSGYACPEYGAAKAGLIRFTSSLAGLEATTGVRVNCVVPDWIGLPRAHEELARMDDQQRARAPRLVAPEDVAAAVLRFLDDDALSGRVLVLRGGQPSRLLDHDS